MPSKLMEVGWQAALMEVGWQAALMEAGWQVAPMRAERLVDGLKLVSSTTKITFSKILLCIIMIMLKHIKVKQI